MTAPLTIDNIEFDKLRAKSPEAKKGGNITYYSIPFEYEGKKSLLKIEGNFRVFRHENKKGISYSLAIGIDDKNEKFFTKLGKGWLNSPMNKRVKFQSHLNHRISNWSRLLEMVNIKMFLLEFMQTSLEK